MAGYNLERVVAGHDGGVGEGCELAVCRLTVYVNFHIKAFRYLFIAFIHSVVDDVAVVAL